ncbi:MAG: cytochrome c oxidase assembly protein [Actinobacteria bacterium]|nr:cytochrome c oxidase assembly protein [Actinomycetota bacterium]
MSVSPLWDILFASGLIANTSWYYLEHPTSNGVSKIRQLSFYSGMALAFILLVGPLAHAAIDTFWIHMVQHVGLMMLISPLIVLGSPIKVLVNSRNLRVKKVILGIGRNLLIRQLFRPEVGFLIFLTILILTHFSPLADAGMVNSSVHEFELVLFLVGGFIYYYPVMSGNPQPFNVPYAARVLSLFAMMLPETMTGFFLYSGNKLLHDVPMKMSAKTGIADQHQGGAIMWAMGMLIDAIWISMAAYEWIANEKRNADADD